jgi:[ribosomal protein S5]-alanine N-acetyltransferase
MDKTHVEFPTPYESPRLTLRSYQPGDGNWYYAMSLRNRAHLNQYESENAVMTITNPEAAEALVGEFAKYWEQGTCFFIGAFEKGTGEFVAQVYVGIVDQTLPEFEIGYFADVAHEGQGYVTEAVRATLGMIFNHLNAHRVRLECAETNLRSIRVAERCGMTREGRLRQNKRAPDGSYHNSLIYGLLKIEFQAG